jgi:hypothetical protein
LTFFTFSTKVSPEICYIPFKSTENKIAKQIFFYTVIASSFGHNLLGHPLYCLRVKTDFFTIWTSLASKDTEFPNIIKIYSFERYETNLRGTLLS